MLSTQVIISPPDAGKRLSDTLARYQQVTGKTTEQILVKHGRNLSFRLYSAFRRDEPQRGEITNRIRGLGWRLGRSGPDQEAGISNTAHARARNKMGGFKSILASVQDEGGRIVLRGVRVGKLGGANSGRRIVGGRRGTGGAAVSGSGRILGSATVIDRRPDEVVLNRRAVETIEEINLREAGRRFLATAWLYRRWLKTGAGENRNELLVNQNPRSTLSFGLLGTAELKSQGNDKTLTLTSNVPGTEKIGRSRGRFANAVLSLRDDIEGELSRRAEADLQREIKAALR